MVIIFLKNLEFLYEETFSINIKPDFDADEQEKDLTNLVFRVCFKDQEGDHEDKYYQKTRNFIKAVQDFSGSTNSSETSVYTIFDQHYEDNSKCKAVDWIDATKLDCKERNWRDYGFFGKRKYNIIFKT